MTGVRVLGRINTAVLLTVMYFIIVPVFYVLTFIFKSKPSINSRWKIKEPMSPKSHEVQF